MIESLFEKRQCLTPQEIDAYVNGSLQAEDRFSIENHLLECQLCSAAVEGNKQKVTASKKKPLYLVLFLVLALILSLLTFFFWPKPVSNPDALFYAYYETPPINTPRSSLLSTQEKAMLLFQQQDYENALRVFDESLQQISEPKYYFYAGIAALELDKVDQSISYLEKIDAAQQPYGNRGTWYLGLALLKKGELDNAIQVFKILADSPNSSLQKDAQAILEKIKGM